MCYSKSHIFTQPLLALCIVGVCIQICIYVCMHVCMCCVCVCVCVYVYKSARSTR